MNGRALIKRLVGPLLWLAAGIALLAWLYKHNATAHEVIGQAFWSLFGFFTTPFILESTVAVIGFLIVITWNQWRRDQETDEWVEMEVPASKDDKGNPDT